MKTKLLTLFFAIAASVSISSAAITVRLDPQSCSSWSTVHLWAWNADGNVFDTNWPGPIIATDYDGWYSYTFDESIAVVNIIWNDGANQTRDITNITESTCFALNSTAGKAIDVSVVDCPETPANRHVLIGNLYYNLYEKTKTVEVTHESLSAYNYYGYTSIDIPSSVNYNGYTYNVTNIGNSAFYGCGSLTSITIPNSVTSIGEYAFFNCSNLTSMTIGNSVTSIGEYAFFNCSSLTSVTIPNSVTSIGGSAFSGCSSLTSVVIPDNVTSIGKETFFGCSSLTSATIGNSVTNIGSDAFYNCSSLTSVTIPNSVTSIGNSAFRECTGLTSVTIPNSVTSIEREAFFGCSGLTSVTIGNSVTSIGIYAFENCSSLTFVTLNSNTIVGKDYENNSNIKSIFGKQVTEYILGDEITSIGDRAFYNCNSLTSVTIGNSVTSIGGSAFERCSSLTSITIPNSVTNIGVSAFSGCSRLTSVTIGNSVTSIGDYAFSGCSGLTSVTIPNSVTSIANHAFYGCSGLTSVTIPNSVTSIEYDAFSGCNSLTSVTIGNSVTSIGAAAFSGCSSLTSITIPNSVTRIGDCAFQNCSSLTLVTIGNSVTSIGYYAFYACNKLTDIFVPCGYLEYYKRLLSNDERVKNKTLAYTVDVTTIGEGSVSGADCIDGDADDTIAELLAIPDPYSRFAGWSDGNTDNPRTIILTQDTVMRAIFEYILTDKCGKDNALTWTLDTTNFALSITGKGELTENYSYGNFIKSVNIGKGVSVIGADAFRDFKNLIAITLSNSVTSIGNHAFYGCSGLTSVIIPEGCDSICDGAFSNCGNITSVTVPSTLTYVGAYAFNTQKILDVYNYATTPQDMSLNNYYSGLGLTMLRGILASARLHVPQQSIELYSNTYFWCYFGHILPIQSTTVETNCVNVSATETTATVVWPQVNNATTYELVIKDKNGNVVCTLVFDSEGKLVSIAFGAPARDNSIEQVQAVGFEFTVTGLESGTSYNLTITAKDNNGTTLDEKTIAFSTSGWTGVDALQASEQHSSKILRDGEVLILRDGKTYTIQGVEVK